MHICVCMGVGGWVGGLRRDGEEIHFHTENSIHMGLIRLEPEWIHSYIYIYIYISENMRSYVYVEVEMNREMVSSWILQEKYMNMPTAPTRSHGHFRSTLWQQTGGYLQGEYTVDGCRVSTQKGSRGKRKASVRSSVSKRSMVHRQSTLAPG